MSVAHRMPDRLQELLQQRALIKEHLAWLDAKIAEASGNVPAPVTKDDPPPAARAPAPPADPRSFPNSLTGGPLPSAVGRPSDDAAQVLLEKLAAEEREKKPPSKSGCWLIFAGAVAVVGLGVWALLSHFYS